MRRLLAIVVILAVLGFGTSRAYDWWNFNVNTPISSASHNVTFHVDSGASPAQIGSDLYDLHLIRSTIAFDMYTRLTDAGPGIDRYFEVVSRLGRKLSVVLWQPPPQMTRPDPDRLVEVLQGEVERVPEPVAGLVRVLAGEVVRHMAVVAGGGRASRGRHFISCRRSWAWWASTRLMCRICQPAPPY